MPLVSIILVDPSVPVEFRYRADCPHCGDHSFPTDSIVGRIIVAPTDESHTNYEGYRRPRPGEPDDITYLRTSIKRPYEPA